MDRYKLNEKNLAIMRCKSKMSQILMLVMNFQADIRITKLLADYKHKMTSDEDVEESMKSMRATMMGASGRSTSVSRKKKKKGISDTKMIKAFTD
jgi:hypothetical protein